MLNIILFLNVLKIFYITNRVSIYIYIYITQQNRKNRIHITFRCFYKCTFIYSQFTHLLVSLSSSIKITNLATFKHL